MDITPFLLKSVLILGGLGIIMGLILTIAYKKLGLKPSEKVEAITKILPGMNCGACGFPSCEVYAEKIVNNGVEPGLCVIGGAEVAKKIGELLAIEVKVRERLIAVLICQGGKNECQERFIYQGPADCRQAVILHTGHKNCIYGCLSLGHCARVCPVGAIRMRENGLPIIDENKCTGCGICVRECPKQTLILLEKSKLIYLACHSKDKGKDVRSVCKVGCFSCGLCIKACPYNALRMENNLPLLDYDKCTGCGICYRKCPSKSFKDRAKARPYAIITTQCNGCGDCVAVCQFKAIEGEVTKRHQVITEKCIGCGECFKVCVSKAITMAGALGYTHIPI